MTEEEYSKGIRLIGHHGGFGSQWAIVDYVPRSFKVGTRFRYKDIVIELVEVDVMGTGKLSDEIPEGYKTLCKFNGKLHDLHFSEYSHRFVYELTVNQIYERYDSMLARFEPEIKEESNPGTSMAHLRWMLWQLATKEMPEGKKNRWLGFIQGTMIAKGLTTVQAERDFTRPYFTGREK